MSSEKIKPSSTAVVTSDDWVTKTFVPPPSAPSRTTVLLDANAVIISGQSRVSEEGKTEIVLSVDPTAVAKRMAIRKLNEELEGRYSPSDTYASRTAG